jgi:hypothetical protein
VSAIDTIPSLRAAKLACSSYLSVHELDDWMGTHSEVAYGNWKIEED